MKKRLLSLTLIAALCLGLLPVTALATAPDRQVIYVGNENVTSGGYWMTDSNGNVTAYTEDGTTPSNNYIHYNKEANTLTLHNATIKKGLDYSEGIQGGTYIPGSAIGVLNLNGDAELTITLAGTNTIEDVSTGIFVLAHSSSTGDASLTITGSGSLTASGNINGINVQSNGDNATLTIQSADVTLNGVTVQAGSTYSSGEHTITLSVEGGSLTASGSTGISFDSASSDTVSATNLTVSNNAIVRANDVGSNISGVELAIGADNSSSGGIVFDGDEGTVYGSVTLQEDLTIERGQTLDIPSGASLTIDSGVTLNNEGTVTNSGTLTNNGKIENSGTLPSDIKGNVPPSITTTSLVDGTVNTAYSATLEASGNPTSWGITDGSLPTNFTLNASTGEISGTLTTAETSTFTVTATNDYGSDSQELTLTIDAQTNVPVASVTLNKSSLSLEVGTSETLTATVLPDNATNKAVTWSSNDSTVATVDESGKVIAVKAGTATITVTTVEGNYTDSCTVTVTAQPSYSIAASPATLNFGSIDDGQAAPAAQTVTITNTGNQSVTVKLPTSTNYTITAGKGFTNGTATLVQGATATFNVQPKAGLSAGTYNETLTISGSDSASAEIALTFTVNKPPYTGKYSFEIVSDVGENGTIDVDRYATEGDQVTITVSPDEAYLLDDLTVTSGGKDVALTDNGDGTYTFTMPSGDVAITATFAEDPNWEDPADPATDVSEIFTDVPANHWAKAAIQYVYDNGLMTGVSDTAFAPEATTTRAMIVSMLARMENVTSAADAGFADVAAGDWYATAVNWAASEGIVGGFGDGTFQPNAAITREQMASILYRYAEYKGLDVSARTDLSHYSDQPSVWAEDVMQWAVAEGLFAGVTDDQLQPQRQATRAQVAAILERFLEA